MVIMALALVAAVKIGSDKSTFDTIAVHRIDVLDRNGIMAMAITNHDDFPTGVINGERVPRSGGNDDNGIVFYNPRGDEQGALVWSGTRTPRGTASENTLSFDTVNTDQLLQVRDANENGQTLSQVIGWNEMDYNAPLYQRLLHLERGPDGAVRAFVKAHPELFPKRRFVLGYDMDNTAQVLLADARGRARIKMFVTAGGQSRLEFLDAGGRIVALYPTPR